MRKATVSKSLTGSGITRLLSVERDSRIKRRIQFNKPYKNIRLRFEEISSVIPTLSPNLRHVLWLDYDDVLNKGILEGAKSAAAQLSVGSMLVITVDTEPPGSESSGPKDWLRYFNEEAGLYMSLGLKKSDFALTLLPRRTTDVVLGAIRSGLSGRRDIQFLPLLYFEYADGHRMVTIGGMFGSKRDGDRLKKGLSCRYLRDCTNQDVEPYEIKVPRITRKERLYLDAWMPCSPRWTPEDFEMSLEDTQAYCEIHKYYPAFAELLM